MGSICWIDARRSVEKMSRSEPLFHWGWGGFLFSESRGGGDSVRAPILEGGNRISKFLNLPGRGVNDFGKYVLPTARIKASDTGGEGTSPPAQLLLTLVGVADSASMVRVMFPGS